MNERIDITNDVLTPLPDTATELAQQPRHTTSRLALLVVGLVASCSLAVGCFMYWRDSNIALPPIYGVSRTQNDSTGTSTVPEIDESNFEAELAEIELDFQETEAELDMSLDEIDAELEAQFDAQ